MRQIDADALKATISKLEFNAPNERYKQGGECVLNFYMPKIIDGAPTIEAESVRHGKWLDCDYKKLEHGFIETYPNAGKCCSNCRTGFKKEIVEGYIFCPNCGARMDGGISDGINE